MRNEATRSGLAGAVLLTLLMVAGAVAADRDTRLVEAARKRDQPQVRTLLTQHADVNVRSDDGATALLWAAHWDDLDIAELLIRAGADVNAANAFQMIPLSEACTNGSAALVDRLLKAGANPNTPIATGQTPIMTCASSGSAEAVRMLLAHGADVNAKEPSENQTALMWAASEHYPHVVAMLIELGADVQARSKKGFTALHFAARDGDVETTRLLLAAGVNVNVRSQPVAPPKAQGRETGPVASGANAGAGAGAYNAAAYNAGFGGRAGADSTIAAGSTPLHVATVRAQVPLALFLLDQGADPNIADPGFTPLHWAAGTWENGISNPVYGFVDPMSGIPDRQAKLQLVKALLAHGADPNARMTRTQPRFGASGIGGYNDAVGATPFILASNAADVEMMRILVGAGADPKLVTKTNTNAVLAATALNRGTGESAIMEDQALEAVNYLLELGVDPTAVTTNNENALFGPAYRGWNHLLELLIDKGADVNVVSKAGVTPWLAASGFGDRLGGVLFNKEGADILLKHGADPKLGKPCQAQNKCR